MSLVLSLLLSMLPFNGSFLSAKAATNKKGTALNGMLMADAASDEAVTPTGSSVTPSVEATESAEATASSESTGSAVTESPSSTEEAEIVTPDAIEDITMVEGDVRKSFVPTGKSVEVECEDSSIAWIDEDGNLKAFKEGKTTIDVKITSTDEEGEKTTKYTQYNIIVNDYTDDSELIGQLKILARFNNSMNFYDGHVYLLFTSYQDNVTINVDDLYAGYEISGLYYRDIREDISNGSNHTGTDTDKYFTFNDEMKSVTLDKGEIVTIGMYRDFDDSVFDAAFGVLKNSTGWANIVEGEKTALMTTLFDIITNKTENVSFLDFLKPFMEYGDSYNDLLNGVTNGGVCFNRELYNQKLEYDQYENVTYETDITKNQLDAMVDTLDGNLNKFSFVKNSCATIAVNAWNAAVGYKDGKESAYHLSAKDSGIYNLIDVPRAVKNDIMEKLPGHYLNNNKMVEEPNAGYEDETGWVYVSAPEKTEYNVDDTNYLETKIVNNSSDEVETEIYTMDGETKSSIGLKEEVEAGTKVHVKPVFKYNYLTVLDDITLNGVSIKDEEHFDAENKEFTFDMPENGAWLKVTYKDVEREYNNQTIQMAVGEELDVTEYAEAEFTNDDASFYFWEINSDGDSEPLFEYADDSKNVVEAVKAGDTSIYCKNLLNENIDMLISVQVFESRDDMVEITYTNEECIYNYGSEGEEKEIPYSGYYVKKGTEINVVPNWSEAKVISEIKCNNKTIDCGKTITADEDLDIKVSSRNAEIKSMPDKIELDEIGDTYQLRSNVQYKSPYGLLMVYDSSIRYEVSSSFVEVDEDGLLTVVEDIPEEGAKLYLTAYAGSSNDKVFARTKVILGDYSGDDIVGKLTILARPIIPNNLVPHGTVVFTTYKDVDLDVSYYEYYKPTEKYEALMEDYKENPDNYKGDPAYYENASDIEDRDSYFDIYNNGKTSEPETISLKENETISISNIGFEEDNLIPIIKAFQNSTLSNLVDADELLEAVQKYMAGEEIDGGAALENLTHILLVMIAFAKVSGTNPADGYCEGGLCVNREMYNQFVNNGTQLPNNYYSIELTADEFEEFKEYLADPSNNNYSLFNLNCASGVRNLWNETTADRPELKLSGNSTGLMVNGQELYYEIGKMKSIVTGTDKAGSNFYIHTPYYEAEPEESIAPSDEPSTSPSEEPSTEPSASVEPSAVPTESAITPSASPSSSVDTVTKVNMYDGMKVTQTNKSITLKWSKVSKATGYKIYAGYAGKKCKVVKTINKNSTLKATIKKINGKKINLKKNYIIYVTAIKKSGSKTTTIGTGVKAYIAGINSKKFTNPTKLKVKKSKLTIKVKKTKKINASITLKDKKKQALKASTVAKFRYVSSNKKIAKVNKKGKITAVKKGSCKIYVYSANGLMKKVKVTVKK